MTKASRLLYVLDVAVDNPAANSVQVLSMCKAFAQQGLEVTLAIPQIGSTHSDDELRSMVHEKMGSYPEFSITSFKMRTPFGRMKLLASYFPVKALLKKVRPDIVFLRNVVLVDAALRTRTPFIYEAHNSLMHDNIPLLNTLWSRYIVRVASNPLMRQFVTISGALGDFWIDKGVPQGKVIALHDAIDPEKFASPVLSSEARESVGLAGAAPLVVYAGSLYEDRGIEDIIFIAGKTPHATFVIVGGPQAGVEKYRALAEQQSIDNIKFVGHVEHKQVPKYLFAADVLLMTWSRAVKTINYCSPLKLFEYMAAGRVIVGHGFPTIKEVLVHGEDALLADPDSREDLLSKVNQALASDGTQLAARAREKVFKEYTWEKRAEQIIRAAGLQVSV